MTGRGSGCRIRYSREPESALDTGGGIRRALALLGSQRFLVVNSDVWSDYAFENLRTAAPGDAHIVLVDNPQHNPDGDFALAPDGTVVETQRRAAYVQWNRQLSTSTVRGSRRRAIFARRGVA